MVKLTIFTTSVFCSAVLIFTFVIWSRVAHVPKILAQTDESVRVWISTLGNDSTCTRNDSSKPCLTIDQAYRIAQLGDVVEIASGDYGNQTVLASGSKGQPDVDLSDIIFRSAPNAKANFGDVIFRVPHVTLQDVSTKSLQARYRPESPSYEGSGDVHFLRIKAIGGRVMFVAVNNFSLIDSEIGFNNRDGVDIYGSGSGIPDAGHYPSNGLIQGNWIHDLTLTDSDHIDGIQFNAGHDIVIRNNRIENIYHEDVLVKSDVGPTYNITFENNWFDNAPGFSLMFVRTGLRRCDGNIIRYNSFIRAPTPRNGPDDQCSGQMYGNIITNLATYGCGKWLESFTVTDNTYVSGVACGTNPNLISVSPFVSVDPFDLHIKPEAVAGISTKGYVLYCPIDDIDKELRPLPSGTVCDAGSDEVLGAVVPITGDINLDHIVNAIDYSIINSKWFTTDTTSDLNKDGIVNAIDFSMLNANWFKTW